MSDIIRNIKGTKDTLPGESRLWLETESIIHNFMSLHGYNLIRTPIFGDISGEIDIVNNRTELVLKKSYEELAPTGYIKNNIVNLGQHSTFNEFYINYTSSVSTKEPIYGSLRADIKGITSNTLTLKKCSCRNFKHNT